MNIRGKATIIGLIFAWAAMLAGCQSEPQPAASDAASPPASSAAPAASTDGEGGLDMSEHADLQFYMLGEAPKDLSKVEEAVNRMAEAELNATVHFNFIAWTDFDLKYKMLLSSGEPVDLLFTADWTQYATYAKRGAFRALDDLLPSAAPALQKYVPAEMWNDVKIDGKIYTVPSIYQEYVTGGFVWREDLREKYNLPKPVDIRTFEAYLKGIKKYEPDIQPVAIGEKIQDALAFSYLDVSRDSIGSMPYGMLATYDHPEEIKSYWGSPEQLEDLKLFKRWSDAGYFSKNELNISEYNQDKIINGTAAAMFGDNPTRYNEMLNNMQAAHPEWQLGYYPFPMAKGYSTQVYPTHNGYAIPKTAKHPERALAFYEKLVTDKRYNQLTQYGFEGVNYKVANGYYQMIGDTSTNGFPREAMNSWAWRNPEYMLFTPSYKDIESIFAELDRIKRPDIYSGFAEDDSDYLAEKTALEQVQKLYLYPLLAGLVDDVDAGLQEFMKNARQGGLDKVQSAYKKQWLAYLQTRPSN